MTPRRSLDALFDPYNSAFSAREYAFDCVDLPEEPHKRRRYRRFIADLHKVPEGKALVYPVSEGDNVQHVRSALVQAAKREDLKVHTTTNDDKTAVLVWRRRDKENAV